MSGTLGDRLVMVFPPGWPAVLAVGMVVTGSFKVVGAAAATFGLVATYALALEVLRDRWAAVGAAAFVGLSPLMLILGGTVLSYPFALGLGAALGAAVLQAERTSSARPLLAAGVAAGLLVAMRPLDAALVTAAFGAHLLWSWRRRLRLLAQGAALASAGGLPFVLALLASNRHVTGSPLRFPLHANGGDNRMGFGPRQISAGARVFDVTPEMMQRVTGRLLGELPHWTLGGLLVAPLVAWGAVRLWRRRPAHVPLLLAVAAAFPAAYFFYWGSHLVWVGRRDYGPFYYLPMLVPLGVAVADGLHGLARRSRVVAVLVVAALLATLPPALAPKHRRAVKHNAAVARELALVDRLPDRSVVIIPASNDGPWMLHVRGYFRNPPDLDADRLYAADAGTSNVDLVDRFPDRPLFQLYGVLGGDRVVGKPDPTASRLRRVGGGALDIETSFVNATDNPTVVSYLGVPNGYVRCVVDERSVRGRRYETRWRLTPAGPVPPPSCQALPPVLVDGKRLEGYLVVGYSAAATSELDGVNKWERVFALRPRYTTMEVLVPGVPRRTSAGDLGEPRADFPGEVEGVLDVEVTAIRQPAAAHSRQRPSTAKWFGRRAKP